MSAREQAAQAAHRTLLNEAARLLSIQEQERGIVQILTHPEVAEEIAAAVLRAVQFQEEVIRGEPGPQVVPVRLSSGDAFKITSELWDERHGSVAHFRPLFEYMHLPEGAMRDISGVLADTAAMIVATLQDGPELSAGLRSLLQAKDAFVRQAGIDSGRIA